VLRQQTSLAGRREAKWRSQGTGPWIGPTPGFHRNTIRRHDQ